MHELDKGLRKVVASAISDPGATEGYKRDRTLTEWQTDAVMRALSSTTSAGVTEEQTPRATEALVEAFRKPGMMVFLDGRNEHGSHVIPSLPMNMEIDDCEGDMPEFAEEIICAAEALGFAVGEHVWTEWFWHRPQIGDEGRVEFDGYWEFVRVNPVVSRALEASRVAPVSQIEEPFTEDEWHQHYGKLAALAHRRLALSDLIKTRLLGVHPDDQDLVLEDGDWADIVAALEGVPA